MLTEYCVGSAQIKVVSVLNIIALSEISRRGAVLYRDLPQARPVTARWLPEIVQIILRDV